MGCINYQPGGMEEFGVCSDKDVESGTSGSDIYRENAWQGRQAREVGENELGENE